ncbi:MAG TPA: hypothetical protein VN924_21945 [Bryobacteraceae bacterium]|jgi:hypothetical protein|nr:hypothetical protein [Bryobacteraceae bacterium]
MELPSFSVRPWRCMAHAAISSSRVEVNFASFPADGYPALTWRRVDKQRNFRVALRPARCEAASSISSITTPPTILLACVLALWGGGNNNSARGGTSTPWDVHGNIQTAWVNSLCQFFSDLHTYGIQYVTPWPVMTGTWMARAQSGYPMVLRISIAA